MGKRLAESGYSVLVVQSVYRSKKAPVAKDASSTPIQEVFPLARSVEREDPHTTTLKHSSSGWTPSHKPKEKKIGTIGYCMGGPIVMRTAAAVPERVGAGATFHGGGLVTRNRIVRTC